MIGRSVGKYRILERIGRGGMGTVYRALDDTLQREVAIKVLNAEITEPEALKRFRSEAIALAKLHHPAVATLFELHEQDGDLMMVMEFVRGETLQKLADRMGPMPPDFAAQLCAQALDGLSHAHRAGIIHRDLKPGNIMVTDEGVVKVMDFGIARIAGSEHLTSDGLTMGTPAYMAPEQVLGREADARSDVYAIGVVLYRLWTGRPPFDGETPFAIAHKQVHDPLTPLSATSQHLPAWCDAVLARALAKNPADRYQTAQEFRTALTESARFLSIDDLATATLRTPGAVAMERHASHALAGEPLSAPVRPATGSVKEPSGATASGATLVISARQMFAGVGALALVLVILVVGAVIAIRRAQAPAATGSATPAPADAAQPAAAGPSAANPPQVVSPPAIPAPVPAPPASPTVQKVPAAPRTAPAPPSAKPAPEDATRGAAKVSAPAAEPDAVAATPTPAPLAAPTAAATLPPVLFNRVKLLVLDGDKTHEEDADLHFADGNIVIYGAGRRVVATMPYSAVRVSSASRSRQPRWRQPSGIVAEAKLGGGPLGLFKSDRTWVGLATQSTVYVFRIDDGRSQQLSTTITQRTGIPVVRLR